jgi:hypothetical protein
MRPVRICLNPPSREMHTELELSLPLRRPWTSLELQQFSELITAYSGNPVRFVLPADSPREWLDPWCDALAEAASQRIEIQFHHAVHRRQRVPTAPRRLG